MNVKRMIQLNYTQLEIENMFGTISLHTRVDDAAKHNLPGINGYTVTIIIEEEDR